jgi:branched-chain amino acid transport system ATP-binding protein
MGLLDVMKLTKNFGGIRAVNEIDIGINTKEVVGLLGPNGSGKTTIFNLITGYLVPDNGGIRYKGENIFGLRPDQIAKKGIGRTFQLTLLFHGQTVFESLLAGHVREERTGFWHALFNTNSYQEEQKQVSQRGLDILKFMGLTEWKDTLVDILPCGIQRFLGIAQAIMSPTEILLLDEPFSGLNEEETSILMDRIKKLQDQGISIFIIEHHMKTVMALCDRIIVINFGKKIAEGLPEDISKNPAVIEAYLGSKRGKKDVF